MSALLPEQNPLRITQSTGPLRGRSLADLDHLLIAVPAKTTPAFWAGLPEGARLKKLWERLAGSEPDARVRAQLANAHGTAVTLKRLPKAPNAYQLLHSAGELAADVAAAATRIGVVVAGDGESADATRDAIVLALGASRFRMPQFTSKKPKKATVAEVRLLGLRHKVDVTRISAEIAALNLVRWLTALPPNQLTATAYRELVVTLAEHHDWSQRFLDVAALRQLGAGAFLAVAQGNAEPDAGILHLSWRPTGARPPEVALVGKGIIFDTGGTNLKPFRAMLDMHHDMAGSAVALGVLLAVTRLKLPIAVDCWLAITENRPGPTAYKSRDVVRAANGTTIEVIHTDAEGRMALADTLALASREQPALVVDYATLTGQCVNALTDRYSGVFTNRPALNDVLTAAGVASGERVWPFPMDSDFDEEIKSTVADVVQCSVENEGDHILAARFLQRFVGDGIPWVHVDLAAATRKKPLGQVPAGPTGFGVRFTLALLIDQAAALAAHRG